MSLYNKHTIMSCYAACRTTTDWHDLTTLNESGTLSSTQSTKLGQVNQFHNICLTCQSCLQSPMLWLSNTDVVKQPTPSMAIVLKAPSHTEPENLWPTNYVTVSAGIYI